MSEPNEKIEIEKVVNIAEIISKFCDGDEAEAKVAYELLGNPSDEDLALFHFLDKKKNIPICPAGRCGIISRPVQEGDPGYTEGTDHVHPVIVSTSRFEGYGPSIIVMKATHGPKLITYSIFADEADSGWKEWRYIEFKTLKGKDKQDIDSQIEEKIAEVRPDLDDAQLKAARRTFTEPQKA